MEPIRPQDVSVHQVTARPFVTYVSGILGVTGSARVFRGWDNVSKDVPILRGTTFKDARIEDDLVVARRAGRSDGSNFRQVRAYMDAADALAVSARQRRQVDILRYVPSWVDDLKRGAKGVVKNLLMPAHRVESTTHHWAYTNYNSLHFFATGSGDKPALMYPNVGVGTNRGGLAVSGTYDLTGAFRIEASIKVALPTPGDVAYKAGTLLHLSSSYALSVVSGSRRDAWGRPTGFRLCVQLSHSADIPPSTAVPGTGSSDLVFWTSDNSLSANAWHRVVVEWDPYHNGSTGSVTVDGTQAGTLPVGYPTVCPRPFVARGDPDVLVVGNYYEGSNAGGDATALWFSHDPATRQGTRELVSTTGVEGPSVWTMVHPFVGEAHHIKVSRDAAGNNVAFDLPVLFVSQAPTRSYVGTHGGILQTPFYEEDGTTSTPFNASLAFGVGGREINVENFVRDFGSGLHPRLHELTSSAIPDTTSVATADQHLNNSRSFVRRNLLIVPCDDGDFVPDPDAYPGWADDRTRPSVGGPDLGWVSLEGMVPSSSIGSFAFVSASVGRFGSIERGLAPAIPEDPRGVPTSNWAVLNRTRDPSSDFVVFFDVSNIFYGDRIDPGSLVVRDKALSGTNGRVSVTLADDGAGGLYRSDSPSPARWSNVGNVFYEEGIIVVKSPHLAQFGSTGYEIEFRGQRSQNVVKVDALAPAGRVNSSSQPGWVPGPVDSRPENESHVWVSAVQLHDENFNVVARTQFAKPVLKRDRDEFLFRTKIDF